MDTVRASSLMEFSKSPSSYYRKVVLGESDKHTPASLRGTLVDMLIQGDAGGVSELVAVMEAIPPTGQMLQLCDFMVERVSNGTPESAALAMGYDYVGFKAKKLETVKEEFKNSWSGYFAERLAGFGKIPVTRTFMEDCIAIKDRVVGSRAYQSMFGENREVVFQEQIVTMITKFSVSSRPDYIVVDHTNKTVGTVDLKIKEASLDGVVKTFLMDRYHIQGVFHWACAFEKASSLGYKALLPSFLVHSLETGETETLTMSSGMLEASMWGGTTESNFKYPGVAALLEDLAWHHETGLWNRTRVLYQAGGITLNLLKPDGFRTNEEIQTGRGS